METKFKKLSLALLTLGLSGVAAAGGYVPPPKQTGYHLGIEVHYLHPHNDSDVMRFARTVGTTEHTIHVADFDWQWGFNLEAAYHDGDMNDYKLEWTYLDDSTENTTVEDANSTGSIPYLRTFYSNSTNHHKIRAEAEADFNQVNFEIGHTYDTHNNFILRVHGGLAWAEVDKELRIRGFDENGDATISIDHHADFEGVGIRTGADMTWGFSNEFSIFARAAVALLYGDLEASIKVDTDSDKNWEEKLKTDGDEETIVPELQARIGVAWDHDNWTIHLGWRHDVLIHADKFVDVEYSTTVLRDGYTGNYSHGGPFLGVIWRG